MFDNLVQRTSDLTHIIYLNTQDLIKEMMKRNNVCFISFLHNGDDSYFDVDKSYMCYQDGCGYGDETRYSEIGGLFMEDNNLYAIPIHTMTAHQLNSLENHGDIIVYPNEEKTRKEIGDLFHHTLYDIEEETLTPYDTTAQLLHAVSETMDIFFPSDKK